MECCELCANLETDHFDFVELTGAKQELSFMQRRESTRRAHVKEKAFSSNSPRLLCLVLLRRRLLSQAGSDSLAKRSIQLRPSMALA